MTQGALDWYQAAHPRVSGENGISASVRVWASGSSPRERGKHRVARVESAYTWLIPA